MRHIQFISLLFAAAAVFAACDNTLGADDDNEAVIKDEEYDFHTIVRTKSDAEMTKAVNTFCFNLYNIGYAAGVNTLWSPMSFTSAMSMAAVGANGKTRTEITDALGFTQMTMDDINDYNSKLVKTLLSSDPSIELSVDNSAWISELYKEKVKTSYTQQISTFYDAEINYADFSKAEDASKIINDWCSQKTDGQIKEIIYSGDIDDLTRLILLNTVLFKGGWSSTNVFDAKNDFGTSFTSDSGQKVGVEMMAGNFDLPYFEDETTQAISLPFGNGALKFTIVLPSKEKSFETFAQNFDYTQWKQIKEKMAVKSLSVAIPRFEIELKSDGVKLMSQLGVTRAFDPLLADFNSIMNGIFISKINHSTKLTLDEEGATASAATVIEFRAGSNGAQKSVPEFDFFANHPFMFAIEESSTGAILFIGSKVQ